MSKPVLPYIVLFVLVIASCNSKKPLALTLMPLQASDLNYTAESALMIPSTGIWKERARLHDSCMGVAFKPNVLLINTKDSFLLGTIFDKTTMKPVIAVNLLDQGFNQALKEITVISKPCYDQLPLNISISSFFNTDVVVKVPGAEETINYEINEAIKQCVNATMQIGSWSYISLNTAEAGRMDTTTDKALLFYKAALLQKDNIVLVKIAGVNSITFYIHSNGMLSTPLKNLLTTKPALQMQHPNLAAQLFYIDDHSFAIGFTGFYPMMGEFMRCVLQ